MSTLNQPQHETDRARLPHVVLDEASRILKARKIVDLLGQDRFTSSRRILEIGCGSGVIASTLAKLGEGGIQVFAVDVVDNRMTDEGYEFRKVEGTALPFESGMFDIVITNHVIEHVGGESDQLHHLNEIFRVLAPSGMAYLAVPNKWRIVEPHYRLPLLSWLPQGLSDKYVRATRRGTHYDCLPLDHSEAVHLFRQTAFVSEDLTIEAIRSTLNIEHAGNPLARLVLRFTPDWAFKLLMPIIPTIIFRLSKRHS